LLSIIYNRRGTNYTIYVYIPNTFSRLLLLLLLYALVGHYLARRV